MILLLSYYATTITTVLLILQLILCYYLILLLLLLLLHVRGIHTTYSRWCEPTRRLMTTLSDRCVENRNGKYRGPSSHDNS